MKNVNVLVVDHSVVVRQVLSELLDATPDLNVIHAVANPLLAIERMKVQWPDVIVLDVEMPAMDGITFLKKIMDEQPTPVVICSTLTETGTQTTMAAMAAGAVAIIAKPKQGLKQFLHDNAEELIATVRTAAQAKMRRIAGAAQAPRPAPVVKHKADVILPSAAAPEHRPAPLGPTRLVAIGASTGGTQALEEVLAALPANAPPIVIVQHMPESFTAAFAARLDTVCEITVMEARHNDRVMAGRALIAPGGKHMLLRREGSAYFVDVIDGPLVNRHRPSVDVLFRSVAKSAGAGALGIILTGMGDDGADGLLEMREAGAHTVAQDEDSCVVYGMPKEAVKRGAAEKIVALKDIDKEILAQLGALNATSPLAK